MERRRPRVNGQSQARLGPNAPQVRQFWQIGAESFRKNPAYSPNDNGVKHQEADALRQRGAAELRWCYETLRVARIFAQRCSRKELERLLEEAKPADYQVGYSVLTTVFQVPTKVMRERLWRRCLDGKLSKAQVKAAKRSLCGNQANSENVGRTPVPPRTRDDALEWLRQEANRFRRMCLAMSNEAVLSRLPRAQRNAIDQVRGAMAKLARKLSSSG